MKNRSKSPILINLEYSSAILGIWITKALPLKFAYFLASTFARVFFIFDFKHKNRTIIHLLHAGICKNKSDACRMARKNYIHLAKVAVEIFKFRETINRSNVREFISTSDSCQSAIELFPGEGLKGMQGIIITAHYGNWEIAGPVYSMLSGRRLISVMRPFDNPKIGGYLEKMRMGSGHRLVHKKGALKAILHAVKDGDSVCFLADQHAGRNEGVETTFFGHPARTHSSPAALHLKTRLPIYLGLLRRVDDDFKFEFMLSDPLRYSPTDNREKDIVNISQWITSEFERHISKYPEQWMWTHRRWLDIHRKKDFPRNH